MLLYNITIHLYSKNEEGKYDFRIVLNVGRDLTGLCYYDFVYYKIKKADLYRTQGSAIRHKKYLLNLSLNPVFSFFSTFLVRFC